MGAGHAERAADQQGGQGAGEAQVADDQGEVTVGAGAAGVEQVVQHAAGADLAGADGQRERRQREQCGEDAAEGDPGGAAGPVGRRRCGGGGVRAGRFDGTHLRQCHKVRLT